MGRSRAVLRVAQDEKKGTETILLDDIRRNKRRFSMEPLLIAGMYKSGTSWLLTCLSAHHQCLGFNEIDLIKSVGAYRRSFLFKKTFRLHDPATRIQTFFGKSSWCHLPISFYQDLIDRSEKPDQTLLDLPPRMVIDRITQHFVPPGHRPRHDENYAIPRNFLFFKQERLEQLYRAILHTKDLDVFLNTVFQLVEEEMAERDLTTLRYYVFKGADQISVIDALNNTSRPLKKLIIVRDGRDATISAIQFRKLMIQRKAAWVKANDTLDYFKLLESWGHRVAKVRKRMDDASYYVLRYEDFNLRFHETFAKLLNWLGLEANPDTIEAIHSRTSFEAVTGRKRGQEKNEVIRKGAVREWAEVLSKQEKKEAWRIAGKQLQALGYPER